MSKDISQMSIYEKLSAISNEISVIPKTLTVGEGKKEYKALSEKDVKEAVKKIEEKYRVFSYSTKKTIILEETTPFRKKYPDGTITETPSRFVRIENLYKFVNLDNPSETVEINSFGDGIDFGDKAVNKAMTYSEKYALINIYKIISGDDPDATASTPKEEAGEAVENVAVPMDFFAASAEEEKSKKITQKQISSILAKCSADNIATENVLKIIGVEKFSDITKGQYNKLAQNWSTMVVPAAREMQTKTEESDVKSS